MLLRAYGLFTNPIAHNAVAEESDETASSTAAGTGQGESLQSKLNGMFAQRIVSSVTYSAGSSLCAVAGNTATITFVTGMGNAPLFEVVASDTVLSDGASIRAGGPAAVVMAEARDGTSVRAECSGRGTCDRARGSCTCQAGYGASDGDNGAGTVDDCGMHDGVTTLACPGSPVCSGNGICESSSGEFRCNCYRGFKGADCSLRACPTGTAWFDEAYETDRAHRPAECSNRGVCNSNTGDCNCDRGYTGAACQRKKCPSTREGECGGRGLCKTVGALALLGHFNGDFAGGGRNEVQRITCTLGSGSFRLTYSHAQTRVIQWDDSLTTLQNRLEALPGLGFVAVSQVSGSGVCQGGAGSVVDVEFLSDFGSLPLIGSESASVTVARERASTRVTYGATRGDPATWDSDKLQGCHCGRYPDYNKTSAEGDKGHWDGPTCDRRTCPFGNDARIGRPLRYSIACTADGGSLTWTFSGDTATLSLAHNGDADALQTAVQSIGEVERAVVTMDGPALCSASGETSSVWIYTNVDERATTHLAVGTNGLTLAGGAAGTGTATITYKGAVLGVENQTVTCAGDGGSFKITFRGKTTAAIAHDASASQLKAALEALPTIGAVGVTMPSATSTACSAAGTATDVQFFTQLGDIPNMIADGSSLTHSTDTPTVTVVEKDKSTTINVECSGRGRCDTRLGICKCISGYVSSDGVGGYGARGDCGSVEGNYEQFSLLQRAFLSV